MENAFTAHNIRLDDGRATLPSLRWTIDRSTVLRAARTLLGVVYPEGLAGKTIVDVGCLEGGYTTEFARLGMTATGIEVRESNFVNCMYVKEHVNLDNLRFIHDDANNIEHHGKFDVFFINGLLYHLDKPREFLEKAAKNCDKVLILQTHVANAGISEAIKRHSLSEICEHEGLRGRWYPEYEALSAEQLERMKWHSWSNAKSFWIQKEYLIDLIRHIGFDLVFEQFDFMDDVVAEMTGGFYKTDDRVMLVGVMRAAGEDRGPSAGEFWYPFPPATSVSATASPEPPATAPVSGQDALEIAALRQEIALLRGSTSWKMTAPLRALIGRWRLARSR